MALRLRPRGWGAALGRGVCVWGCISGAEGAGRAPGWGGSVRGIGVPPRAPRAEGLAAPSGSPSSRLLLSGSRRMQGAGKALQELLLSAQRQGCLTAGVYESAKVLNV